MEIFLIILLFIILLKNSKKVDHYKMYDDYLTSTIKKLKKKNTINEKNT